MHYWLARQTKAQQDEKQFACRRPLDASFWVCTSRMFSIQKNSIYCHSARRDIAPVTCCYCLLPMLPYGVRTKVSLDYSSLLLLEFVLCGRFSWVQL